MHLTSSLPISSLAKLGNKLIINSDSSYTGLQTFDNGIVYRTATQKLIIKYITGEQFEFNNQCSAIFENNTYISPNGLLLWLYKESNKIFLGVFNLVTKSLTRNLYITTDIGFPSIAIDSLLNRVVIYKSLPASGTYNHSYIYSYTFTNNTLVAYHDGVGTNPVDSFIHIAFKKNSTGFYRSIQNLTIGFTKIDYIFHGTLDNQLYFENPVGGSTLVQNVNSTDLWYPHFIDSLNLLLVYNQEMTSVSAWSTTLANTQSVSPFVVDTRTSLFHADFDKIGYPRLYQLNDLIFDQRLYLTLNTIGSLTSASQYPICSNNLVSISYLDINTSDRQSGFIVSNSTKKAIISLEGYQLDDKDACDVEQYGQVKDTIFVNATSPNLLTHTGLINTNLFTTQPNNYTVLYIDQDVCVSQQGFSLTFVDSSATQLTLTLTSLTPLAFVRLNNKLFIKNSTDFIVVNLTSLTTEINSPESGGTIVEAFCWNNKVYFRSNSWVLIYDTELNTYSNTLVVYSRSGKVRLLANQFDGKLYLYDREFPNSIYLLTINLTTEDYTATNFLKTVVDDNLPIGLRTAFDDNLFGCHWVSETDIFFIDYFSNNASVLQNFRNIESAFGYTPQTITNRAAGSETFVFNNYIFDINAKGIFSYVYSQLTFIGYSDLLLETPVTEIITNPPSGIPNQQIFFNSDGENLVVHLNNYDLANQELFSYDFLTVGSKKSNFNVNSDFDHEFFVNYLNSQYTLGIEGLTEESYSKERIIEAETILGNNFSKLETNKRLGIRYKYTVSYLVTESQLTWLVNVYNDQAMDLPGFELFFKDSYREEEDIEPIVVTSVDWNWFAKDTYFIQIEFCTT
jgi:hypothetical protein